jgi:hypothetical protein
MKYGDDSAKEGIRLVSIQVTQLGTKYWMTASSLEIIRWFSMAMPSAISKQK